MAQTVLGDNIYPKSSQWKINNDSGNLTGFTAVDDYSITYPCASEGDYVYTEIKNCANKTFLLSFSDFSSTDGAARLEVRNYGNDGYTTLIDETDLSGPFEQELRTTADCTKLVIRTRHDWGSEVDAVITVSGASLREVETVTSPTTLNFHKLRQESLPQSVEAGTEHIFFTTDGTRVRMYVTNQAGSLIEVTALSTPASEAAEAAYHNPYTQEHIDERKQEIVSLTKQGHCLVFAVATDIHVRIEDGRSGRYNQVRDFIMLSQQLPIDYILCEGDIMSYCQEWDGCFEPRAEAVRKILDQCRCPWYVTRGNHDYNDDDNGADSNPNIKQYDAATAHRYFISDRDWNRTIASKMPTAAQQEIHFDESHPENGYFYVDDLAHKHRIIMCNSEETMETDDGHPYINDGQVVDAYISGVESKAQLQWLIDHAMNLRDKGADAKNWVVSFHSHTLPYSDRWLGYEGEDGPLGGYKVLDQVTGSAADMSEFHGYGWDNPELRQLIHAFQNGEAISFKKGVIDVDDVNDGVTNHVWTTYERTVDFSDQGPIRVLGWFAGHCHDDCHKTVNGLNCVISTCTCASRRDSWSLDQSPAKLPPERNSTDKAMSVNVFVVNLDARKIDVVKVGSKADNGDKTSSDYSMTY